MYNVALIGMGNIGLLFDKDPSTHSALSHAKGIYLSEEFDLKYVADSSDTNLEDLKKLFIDVTYFSDYKSLLTCKDIDILVVATPTITHQNILMDFKDNTEIKYFFMEKPLFLNKDEYENIPLHVQEKIIVNYPRRFEPHFQEIHQKLSKRPYGELKKVIVHYTKGFSNNGSHAIDFLNFLLGGFTLNVANILEETRGLSEEDPTYDIYGKIEHQGIVSTLYFIGFDYHHLTTFSVELFFQKAIIKYDDTQAKISIQEIKPDPIYPEYLTATAPVYLKETMMDTIMLLAYKDLHQRILGQTSYACSFEEELSHAKFKNKILRR